MRLIAMLSITILGINIERNHTECFYVVLRFLIVMPNAFMLSAIVPSAVMPNVVMLSWAKCCYALCRYAKYHFTECH